MPAPPTRPPATRRPAGTVTPPQETYDYSEYSTVKDQTEEMFRTRDSRSFKDIFDPSKISGHKFFKPTPGDNLIDYIPFPAGPLHPEVCMKKRLQVGARVYVLEVWVHQNVGPNNDQYLCLAKTYGRPCSICEFQRSDEPGSDAKELNAKRRTVYLVWDRKHEDLGLQIWEVAHFFMEKNLQARVQNPKTGAKIAFAHPSKEEGKHIAFGYAIKGKMREYTGHQFVDRDAGIPKYILDQAFCLDDLLHIPTYEEVESAFYGQEQTGQEDSMEPQSQGQEPGEPTCPVNGVFGTDYWAFVECETCPVQNDCAQLAPPEAAQEQEPEPPPPPPPQPTRRAAAPAPAAPVAEHQEAPRPIAPRPLRRQVT